jgi:dihydropteroate synthase
LSNKIYDRIKKQNMDLINTIKKAKKPVIMGILNLTPDSFSDGSKFNNLSQAIARIKEMEKEGADIIDIGGESTGPNSKNVSLEEERERVIPILKEALKVTKLPISIDTYKSKIAEECLQLGAKMINDVTAFRGDKEMVKVVAKYKVPVILMYSKDKTARTTQKEVHYKNVIKTVEKFLKEQIQFAKKHGIKDSQIIIDPGMGNFISKVPKYSFEILNNLKQLKSLKKFICIGASRKSFLGGKIEERDKKGEIASAIAYLNGASIIRTHDVKGTKNILESL